MYNFAKVALVSALALAPAGATFAADSYTIDAQHAWVSFTTSHAGWANAHGVFRTVAGDIEFDKEDVTNSSVKVTIDATSVDTNLEGRDDHLRSPDFLNAEEFPTIDFVSTAIEQTGEKTALVTGDLTLAGVTKPVVLDVVWGAEFPLPWDASTVKTGFSATTSFNALDFGINKVSNFGLGPVINVSIDLEAIKN